MKFIHRRSLLLILLGALLPVLAADAEPEKRGLGEPFDSLTLAQGKPAVSAPSAPLASSAGPGSIPIGVSTPETAASTPWIWRLFGRMHPMVVHFPIALLLMALLVEGVRVLRRKPAPADAALAFLWFGALSAAAAAAMGWANAETGTQAGVVLERHRWFGTGTAGLAFGAAVLASAVRFRPSARALGRLYLFVLLAGGAAVSGAGHLGGVLVYGDDYLTSAMPGWMKFWEKKEAPSAVAAAPAGKIDFVKDIQPLLKESCYSCHGPEKQKGDLRLDAKHLAIRGGKSKKAILPGDGEFSTTVRRLLGLDNEKRMPQNADPWPAEKIAKVKAWIEQGAEWPDAASVADAKIHRHWAYVKPERPEVPSSRFQVPNRTAGGKVNPVDAFIRARLEKEGLSPSPEASRETLIRRVSIDLTGLPPTPEETDAFVADASPDAYEKLVDRLLASPHYGERWTRLWLDLARYADSNGYEKDNRRIHWKYRDWVIDAFNRDMPFDRFTIEQIAGDMLPDPTEAQKIATGFHRNTMINEEGGVDGDEAHWEVLVDRVNTTGTVWLGSTVACSQCHNHKFDPFTQKDYYRFLSFFNNVELGTRSGAGVVIHHETTLEMPTPEQEADRKRLREEIAGLEKALNAPTPELEAAQAEWEKGIVAAAADWTVLEPETLASAGGATMAKTDGGAVLVSGENPARDVYTVTTRTDLRGITAVRLEVLTDPSLPQKGPGRSEDGEFILTGFEVEAAPLAPSVAAGSETTPAVARSEGPATIAFAEATADQWRGGHEPANLLSGKPDHPGWTVDAHRVDRQALFLTKEPFGFEGGTRLTVRLKHEVKHLPRLTLGKFRLSVTAAKDPKAIVPFPAAVRAIAAVPPEKRTDARKGEIAAHYRSIAPALNPTREQIGKIRQALNQVPVVSAMVLRELPSSERPSAVVRIRGGYMSPGEKVWADVPSFLPPLPADAMPNRLGLAKWLVSPENPLTARVTVNRIWETIFGTGIVETTEDFGTQGQPPAHPELLDWLATEFQGNLAWSWKGIVRLLVTSSAYRQSSAATPALREKDPYNRLLARGPRFRMEAEAIRDVALAASGRLSPKIGGPSVFPPQPEGIWDIPYSGDKWNTDEGENRYRRGIYTFARRAAPYPMSLTFDATSREYCTVRRIRTNTPLQALNLMNDEAFFDAARGLAVRMMTRGAADAAERAAYGFRLCAARKPTPAEASRLAALYATTAEAYRKDPAAAAKAVKGAIPPPKELDVPELAAWTIVANVLLNLDETVTKE